VRTRRALLHGCRSCARAPEYGRPCARSDSPGRCENIERWSQQVSSRQDRTGGRIEFACDWPMASVATDGMNKRWLYDVVYATLQDPRRLEQISLKYSDLLSPKYTEFAIDQASAKSMSRQSIRTLVVHLAGRPACSRAEVLTLGN